MILGDSLLGNIVPGGFIGNSSVDMRLHDQWMVPVWEPIPMRPFVVGTDEMAYRIVDGDLVLEPGQFALCRTVERVDFPMEVAGWVEGRSSIGRLGVWVQNAGFIDGGFEGTITLEVYNGNKFPILIPAGYRVCQVVAALTAGVTKPYAGKYQSQTEVTGFLNDVK